MSISWISKTSLITKNYLFSGFCHQLCFYSNMSNGEFHNVVSKRISGSGTCMNACEQLEYRKSVRKPNASPPNIDWTMTLDSIG